VLPSEKGYKRGHITAIRRWISPLWKRKWKGAHNILRDVAALVEKPRGGPKAAKGGLSYGKKPTTRNE